MGAIGVVGLSVPVAADGVASIITSISSSQNWTIGVNTKFARVQLIAGGGGGGSGGTAGAGVACTGGAGGGGGAVFDGVFSRAEILAAYPSGIVPVTIAAGGTGGDSITSATAANGNPGGVGGNTTLGSLATAYGGGGGSGPAGAG